MAESSNYSRSVIGGSDEYFSRSVLGGSDEDYSRSLLGGSDEDYSRMIERRSGSDGAMENPCEPCQNDGKNTTAVKYCADCSEYQCGPCSKQHMKFKAFRHHVVKDVEAVKPVINKGSTKITDKSTNQLAKLDKNSERVQQRPGHVMSSLKAIRNVNANLASTIDTSTSKDNETPNIWDLAVVQTHYCVVTDMDNQSVKVVDTRTRCVTSQKQLTDAEGGWSITSVDDDQVALLAPIKDVCKILLFSVSASGIISDIDKCYDVSYVYSGITHCNARFYAAIGNRIDVLSMQGQIITTITNKSFGGLYGIALSNDHNTLYVCDYPNSTVFIVDRNGNVKASYKDNDLNYPVGITVDSNGYVYVCSTGTVHQLTADLGKGKVIIKDEDVWRCVFNKNDNSLILCFGNKIKVYNLTYH